MFCGFKRERGHFGHEFLDNPLVISKTTLGKEDLYKGHSIPPIGFLTINAVFLKKSYTNALVALLKKLIKKIL
jgi:hypothetical protein